MISKESLQKMSQLDILEASANSLADINNISINQSLPIDQRLVDYLGQVKNPYIFLCGDVKVKISYGNTGKTLDNTLIRCFSNLING